MTLQAKLDEFKKSFESGDMPSESDLERMHRSTRELVESGQAERALGVGDTMPDFELPSNNGGTVRLSDHLEKSPVVVSFYRGQWCPYCNIELEDLRAHYDAIKAAGAELVVVSPQTPANSRKSVRDSGLAFPVLHDAGNEVADAAGLRWTLPDYLREVYRGFGLDLAAFNGDESWTLPFPARYVVGTDGVIRYAEVNADYTQRPETDGMIAVLKSMRNL